MLFPKLIVKREDVQFFNEFKQNIVSNDHQNIKKTIEKSLFDNIEKIIGIVRKEIILI